MKTIAATEFKTHCLALLDEVAESHAELLILKRGVPVARVIPVTTLDTAPQSRLLGTMSALDDLIEPPLPPEAWDVERAV